jgi:hypothetical protein
MVKAPEERAVTTAQRTRLAAPRGSVAEPSLAASRLAVAAHGWATLAIVIGGCVFGATMVVVSAARTIRQGFDAEATQRLSSAQDGIHDDNDDDDGVSEGSSNDQDDDTLYRVWHSSRSRRSSSDPAAAAIGYGYGSFVWSPASTLISVEPASASASSWTGDYFDKFDV